MSISQQLTLLANSKQAIKNSINQKGGSITDSTPFADYSTAIDNLPSGGSGNPLLTSIDVSDFSGTTFNKAVSYITGVTIPSSVTMIDRQAFYECSSLASITIPNTVTSILQYAFYGCSSLTSVTIPNTVTLVQSSVFSACTNLASANIPTSITSIPEAMFDTCSLSSIDLFEGLTTFGTRCFYGNRLTTLVLPSTVTSIGVAAFQNNRQLNYIVCKASTPPTVYSSSFMGTGPNGDCPIYVPSASVAAYKSSWTDYASRIYPIQQVATVDGNPVYNYELGNTDSTTILSTEIVKMPTGTSIEFAEGITNIGGQLGAYEDVTLPNTFTGFLDTQAINAATETLTSLATTPPTAERNNFGGAGLTAIYVPASAVDTYKAASGWSNFASIIEGIPGPTPSVTSITIVEYNGTQSNPADWGEFEGCSEIVNVDAFEAASSSSTFDSDIKDSNSIIVEDNNGNNITSQCTFSSNDYSKWDSTQDPSYDGESEAYYEWRLDTNIEDADAQNPHSATITATYGNLSDTFTIEWTTTSNCEEPEPDPEE